MFNRNPIAILFLFIVGATLLAWALHWLIGAVQKRLVRRFWPVAVSAGEQVSLTRLVFDWGCNGLRTAVWTACLLFIINLIPQTRDNFREILDRFAFTQASAIRAEENAVRAKLVRRRFETHARAQ